MKFSTKAQYKYDKRRAVYDQFASAVHLLKKGFPAYKFNFSNDN